MTWTVDTRNLDALKSNNRKKKKGNISALKSNNHKTDICL